MSVKSPKAVKHKRNILFGALAAVVVAVMGYALIYTRAAGPYASVTATNTTLTGNASYISETDGSRVISFNAPATPPPTTPPPTGGTLMGWQLNENNVGLKPHGLDCYKLPVYTGPEVVPAGTTISGVLVNGRLDLKAGNITIEKSCIRPLSGTGPLVSGAYLDGSNNRAPSGPITIRDSEINGTGLIYVEGGRTDNYNASWSDGFKGMATLQRNYIHHMGSGIAMLLTGTTMSSVIENNYVAHLQSWGDGGGNGTHSDAFTVRDFAGTGRTMSIKNNRFDCSGGNESGALFIQTWLGPINNVTVEGNLLEGGGWNLTLNQFNYPYSGMKAINNRFNPFGGWGAATVDKGVGWAQWTDNYRYDPSKPDAKGTVVPK